jgi:RNA polymerase sigma-70 factor, ECF subfamily
MARQCQSGVCDMPRAFLASAPVEPLSLLALPCRLMRMATPKILPTPGEHTDIEAAFTAGDKRRVLALLMTRYGDGIYRYAVAMTRDRHLAEEIRQQVFVEVFRDLGDVEDPSSLPTWTFGIARHRCLDAVTARLHWFQRYKNELPEDVEQDDCDPDRDLDRSRLARILASCLARLAPAARDAVVLRYQQELSYDEAAAISGGRPGTLQRRVARALPVLRKCVEASLQPGDTQ